MAAASPQKRRSPTAREELNLLHRIIETISYNLDLDEILHEIIRVVDSVAHADEIFLYLLRENELILRSAKRESSENLSTIRLQMGKGITGWVAAHEKPVRLRCAAYEDKRFHTFTNLAADRYEAFLSLPMLYHKKLIGVLNVQHRKPYDFSDREVKLLQTVATATAGAIENARLFEQTTLLSEALAARKLIEKAKGKLMKQYQISEEKAYRWMKKRAMDLRKPMRDIAEAILISIE